MSEQPEVGPAMWGGARLPSEQRRPKPVPEPAPAARPELRDLAALFALVVAAVLVPAGAFLTWGPGPGVLVTGLVAGVVAVLLGLGER